MPIHLDDEFAKEMGLPGIIAHGLCTMAFTSWALLTEVGESDVSRLKRLAVRFAKPVLPGQDITTSIYRSGSADGVTTYAFETAVDGELVIKDGLARDLRGGTDMGQLDGRVAIITGAGRGHRSRARAAVRAGGR